MFKRKKKNTHCERDDISFNVIKKSIGKTTIIKMHTHVNYCDFKMQVFTQLLSSSDRSQLNTELNCFSFNEAVRFTLLRSKIVYFNFHFISILAVKLHNTESVNTVMKLEQ